MVINLRGTSGSGKTFVARSLMQKGSTLPLGDNIRKPDAYQVIIPSLTRALFIIGSYENTCGGCDGISTPDEICDRVRMWAPHGHVLMEGLLMSHTFGRYAKLDRELVAINVHCIWAFLDTPLDVCLSRIRKRREDRRLAKAVPPMYKKLNPTHTTLKWEANRATFDKFVLGRESDWKNLGYPPTKLDARWVPYENAVETVFSWLT